MLRTLLPTAAAIFSLLPSTIAQTSTACNPLNSTCPADPALGTTYNWDVGKQTKLDTVIWNNTGGFPLNYDSASSAQSYTITKSGQAPTIQSNFYYFFGTASVLMKVSSGTGIISAFTSISDDLDEIDFEFMGGNDSFISTNFYGKHYEGQAGNGTTPKLAFDPRADFHNYTTVWSNQTLQWLVDGSAIRTLNYGDAEGGLRFPQTPMQIRLGSWAGGDASKFPPGTVAWAGGSTDFAKAPFDMQVRAVYVQDASSGASYSYDGRSGMSQDIKAAAGQSDIMRHVQSGTVTSDPAAASGTATPASTGAASPTASSASLTQQFDSLSQTAKIAIGASVGGAFLIALLLLTFCCVKQRRAGRQERLVADTEFQKQEAELMAWRRQQQQQRMGQMPGFGSVPGNQRKFG